MSSLLKFFNVVVAAVNEAHLKLEGFQPESYLYQTTLSELEMEIVEPQQGSLMAPLGSA